VCYQVVFAQPLCYQMIFAQPLCYQMVFAQPLCYQMVFAQPLCYQVVFAQSNLYVIRWLPATLTLSNGILFDLPTGASREAMISLCGNLCPLGEPGGSMCDQPET
jgi:hypothetical protein